MNRLVAGGRRSLGVAATMVWTLICCATPSSSVRNIDRGDGIWESTFPETSSAGGSSTAALPPSSDAFLRARTAHTELAYRRFLSDHSAAPEVAAARSLLESLRFDQARRSGGVAGWSDFLREFPDGDHGAEAREALLALQIDQILKNMDPVELAQAAQTHRWHPRAREIESAWESVLAARLTSHATAEEYLRHFPEGGNAVRAHRLVADAERDDIEQRRDAPAAWARARRPGASDEDRRLSMLLMLETALDVLDPLAVCALSRGPVSSLESEQQQRATEACEAFIRWGMADVMQRSRSLGLRTGSVAAWLRDAPPLSATEDPHLAVERLFRHALAPGADDPGELLIMLDSPSPWIRGAAHRALLMQGRLVLYRGGSARWLSRIRVLRDHASTASVWRKMAVLAEAVSELTTAREAWRWVTALDPDDPGAWWARGRLADLGGTDLLDARAGFFRSLNVWLHLADRPDNETEPLLLSRRSLAWCTVLGWARTWPDPTPAERRQIESLTTPLEVARARGWLALSNMDCDLGFLGKIIRGSEADRLRKELESWPTGAIGVAWDRARARVRLTLEDLSADAGPLK